MRTRWPGRGAMDGWTAGCTPAAPAATYDKTTWRRWRGCRERLRPMWLVATSRVKTLDSLWR